MQTSNQAIRDKNNKKETNTTKTEKTTQKWENFTKNCLKICAKRVYDFPPHLNLTMCSLRAEETQLRTKLKKYKIKKTKQDRNIYELTHK